MWSWFNCYLSGRHEYGMWCEPGAICLRCLNCGRRSPGWELYAKPQSRASQPPHDQLDVIARAIGAVRRSIDPQPRTDARASAHYLTASAWADHNTRRARPPHQLKKI